MNAFRCTTFSRVAGNHHSGCAVHSVKSTAVMRNMTVNVLTTRGNADLGDFESSSFREDQNSSESEKLDQEDDDEKSRHSQVHFIVGGDSPVYEKAPIEKTVVSQQQEEVPTPSVDKQQSAPLSYSDREASVPVLNKNVKSHRIVSQNIDAMALETEVRSGRKFSQTSQTSQGSSENIEAQILSRIRRPPRRNELHQSYSTSGVSSAEEDVFAVESPTDDISDSKRSKKSLLHFPKFSRKSSKQPSSSPSLVGSSSSKLPT